MPLSGYEIEEACLSRILVCSCYMASQSKKH